jgi:hypothetical protein
LRGDVQVVPSNVCRIGIVSVCAVATWRVPTGSIAIASSAHGCWVQERLSDPFAPVQTPEAVVLLAPVGARRPQRPIRSPQDVAHGDRAISQERPGAPCPRDQTPRARGEQVFPLGLKIEDPRIGRHPLGERLPRGRPEDRRVAQDPHAVGKGRDPLAPMADQPARFGIARAIGIRRPLTESDRVPVGDPAGGRNPDPLPPGRLTGRTSNESSGQGSIPS